MIPNYFCRCAMDLFRPNMKLLFCGHDFPLEAFSVNSQSHPKTPRFPFSHFILLTTVGPPNSKHGPIPFIFNSFKKTLLKVRETAQRETPPPVLMFTTPHPLPATCAFTHIHTCTHTSMQTHAFCLHQQRGSH